MKELLKNILLELKKANQLKALELKYLKMLQSKKEIDKIMSLK